MANHDAGDAAEYSPAPAAAAALDRLAARRGVVTASLTAVMMIGYFGFIVLVGFAPSTAGQLLGGRVSVGIVLGAAVIVLAPLLVALYVRWANRSHDDEVTRLRGDRP